eukprot:NODE_10_length_61504_cov_0.956502.p53 type:complete len:112 gc:universal NODE_10_length_61504_cov_0.956502:38339-38004(-)
MTKWLRLFIKFNMSKFSSEFFGLPRMRSSTQTIVSAAIMHSKSSCKIFFTDTAFNLANSMTSFSGSLSSKFSSTLLTKTLNGFPNSDNNSFLLGLPLAKIMEAQKEKTNQI